MRIMAIDPAMANLGVWIGDLLPGSPKDSNRHPSWMPRSGQHTLDLMKEVVRGSLATAPTEFMWSRIQRGTDFAHSFVENFRPDLIVTEAVLTHGLRRNVTGGMVLAAILDWYRPKPSPWGRSDWYLPQAVITIPPPKLRSIAHGGRKYKGKVVTKAVVKDRFREARGLPKKTRVTDHEADAFFLAYHGLRFWKTCVVRDWPLEALSREETQAFLHSKGKNPRTKIEHSTALLDGEGDGWWRINDSSNRDSSGLSGGQPDAEEYGG